MNADLRSSEPTRVGVIARLWVRRAQLRRLADTAGPQDWRRLRDGLREVLDLLDEAQQARDSEDRKARR